VAVIFIAVLVGAASYLGLEKGMDFQETFYFSSVTMATVGYGDYLPSDANSK
jgi:hypothetical protein